MTQHVAPPPRLRQGTARRNQAPVDDNKHVNDDKSVQSMLHTTLVFLSIHVVYTQVMTSYLHLLELCVVSLHHVGHHLPKVAVTDAKPATTTTTTRRRDWLATPSSGAVIVNL